jgi:hypothetical protein
MLLSQFARSAFCVSALNQKYYGLPVEHVAQVFHGAANDI